MNKQEKEPAIKWILIFRHTRVKMKESEKMNKYLDLARELKHLWNMKVMMIPIAVGVLVLYIVYQSPSTHLLTLLSSSNILLVTLCRSVCLFRVTIFVLVRYLLSSSTVVLSSSLPGWGMIIRTHFYMHIIYLSIWKHFPFITRCSRRRIREQDETFNRFNQAFLTNLFLTSRNILNTCLRLSNKNRGLRLTSSLIAFNHTDWHAMFFNKFNCSGFDLNAGLDVNNRADQSIMYHSQLFTKTWKKLEEVEIRGIIETIQTRALSKSTKIRRRVLETRGDLLPLRLQWKLPTNLCLKNS